MLLTLHINYIMVFTANTELYTYSISTEFVNIIALKKMHLTEEVFPYLLLSNN